MQATVPEPMPPVGALRDDGTADPVHAASLSDDLAVALYEQMVLAREFDERLVDLQRGGRVSQHASAAGEEGAIVGAAAGMLDEDWLFAGPREHAAALWRGVPLVALAHQAFGSAAGPGKGRDAPGALSFRPARIVSTSPLVGTHVPHAVGVAWAARLRGNDVAALAFFGDGATSSGDFHTGLNFAGVSRAPVVAFCRNNGWATSMPAARQTASAGFAIKALAYGLHGVRVDGGDVIAVRSVVREARARASSGLGGTLIEALTAPLGTSPAQAADAAHAGSSGDPLVRMRRYLEARALWSAPREERLRDEVRVDVDRALQEAERAAPPSPRSLFDDVYERLPWHLLEQLETIGTGAEP
jgi:2-oxoisovalerate dehydrogenase E1 component alpha subunit